MFLHWFGSTLFRIKLFVAVARIITSGIGGDVDSF